MADVFSAFPAAIISDDWKIGELVENTEVGKLYKDLGYQKVIVDEGAGGDLYSSPDAEELSSDVLIYARPDSMPKASMAEYIASYYWYQKSCDQFYRIIDAGIGKNQDAGVVEHYEFRVRPVELAGVASDES